MSRSNSSKNRTEPISNETVKDFLEKNGVSLEKVGGEDKQNEYIAELASALKVAKMTVVRRPKASDEQAVDDYMRKVNDKVNILGQVAGKAGITNEVASKLYKNFIPNPSPKRDQKAEIDSMKKKMDEMKAENDRLKKELEEEKAKTKALEEAKNKAIQEAGIKENVEPVEPRENPSPNPTQKNEPIDVDYTVTDKRDEKAGEYIKDIWKKTSEKNKEIKEAVKKAKTENIKLKPKTNEVISIAKINAKVAKACFEFVDRHVGFERPADVFDMPGVTIKNIGAATIATGMAVTGMAIATVGGVSYMAGELAIKGVKKVAGLAFKAAKGTAKLCKSKVDKHIERRNQERVQKTKEALSETKLVTDKILKYSKDRLDADFLSKDEVDDLSDEKAADLTDIRNSKTRSKTEDKLLLENDEALEEFKKLLDEASKKEASSQFEQALGMSKEDFGRLFEVAKIDENGELFIDRSSPVTLDEIEKAGLDETLKSVVKMPKVQDFDFEDVSDIVYYLRNGGDIEKAEKDDSTNKTPIEFVKAMLKVGYDEADIDKLEEVSDRIDTNHLILNEAYSRDMFEMAEELSKQSISLNREFDEISGDKDKNNAKRLEELRKIATAKVASLRNAGIVNVISENDSKQAQILEKADRILSRDFAQELEHTVDIKSEKINTDKPQRENDDDEQK